MTWNVGTKIATGFAVTLVIFLIVGITSHRSHDQLAEVTELRRQTYDILAARDDLSLASRALGIALRNYVITGTQQHLQATLDNLPLVDKAMRTLTALQTGGIAQRQLMDRLTTQFGSYVVLVRQLVDTRTQRGFEEASRLLQDDATRRTFEALGATMNEVGRTEEAALLRHAADAEQATEWARWTILIGTTVAFSLAALAGVLLTRNISAPLRQLTVAAERITIGDLQAPVDVGPRRDEIGVLSRSLLRMTQSLRSLAQNAGQIATGDLRVAVVPQSPTDELGNAFARMASDLGSQIGRLRQASNDLGAASSEVVASSSQLAASASQTAEAVNETTTTVEEVRQTAHLASQKARKVSDGAQRVLEVSDEGLQSTREVEAGMSRIRAQMEAIAASMERLSEQGRAIGQIIASVEDLATQSNLLAVNAAIEAAKAGEHGRGFSVVAQEVRGLAEQSRQATNQVRTMLGDVSKATEEAVLASEQGVRVVDDGVRQAENAGRALSAMTEHIQEAIQASLQIAASSQQQLVGMDQVAGSMNSIKQASMQNLDSASKLESAARIINTLGADLKQSIERYRA
ncbi:MAG: methyl-accepting chemotaxis protein [Lautropia sp.]